MRDKNLYIEDILNSISYIFDYIKGYNFEDFKNDRKTFLAVVKEFEIIGEAVKNIYDDVKNRYSEIKWRRIIDFRNILTHEYFGIDFLTIWNVIFYKLPELKKVIEKILKEGLE